VKFNNFVSPGKTLELSAIVHKREGNLWTLKTSGTVEGASAVTAKLTLEQYNLADRNPAMKSADETQLASLKGLFAVLWPDTPR